MNKDNTIEELQVEEVEEVKEVKEKSLIPKTAMQIYHRGQWVNCSFETAVNWDDV
jgi:hypothetical protein